MTCSPIANGTPVLVYTDGAGPGRFATVVSYEPGGCGDLECCGYAPEYYVVKYDDAPESPDGWDEIVMPDDLIVVAQ